MIHLKKKIYSVLFLLLALCLSFQVLPGHAHALGEGCNLSGCTCYSCSWRYVYSYTSEDYHLTNVACTGCSEIYGVSNDPHTFSGNTCTLCGYVKSSSGGGGGGGGDTSCDHGRYYYDYSYYNYSYHYVSQTCRYCGDEVDYYRETHSLRGSYDSYSSSQKIGFSINDIGTTKAGSSEALTLSGDWTIQEDSSLPLEYDAVVSAMSQSVTDESILTVVFVLEWA